MNSENNPASLRGILYPLTSTLRQFSFIAYNPGTDSYALPEVCGLMSKFQVRLNILIDVLHLHKDEPFGDFALTEMSDLHETFEEVSSLCTDDQKSYLHLNMAHIYYLINQVGGHYDFHLDPRYYPESWNGVNILCRQD